MRLKRFCEAGRGLVMIDQFGLVALRIGDVE
jgi:hypothetical protein